MGKGKITPDAGVRRLFVRRWSDHLRKQLSILRFTFDGVVLLYIGIPTALLLGRTYYGLWLEELPAWLSRMPLAALPAAFLIILYILGGLLLYIEAADVLFLRQRPTWLRGLMIRGALAGMLRSFGGIGACFALIAPLLVRVYGMDGSAIALVFAVTCGVKAVHLFADNLIRVAWSGWRQKALLTATMGLIACGFTFWTVTWNGLPASAFAALAVSLVLAGFLAWRRFRLRGRFDAEIREEERRKTALTGVLLSGAVDRPPKPRSRSWLFRRSGRLLRSAKPEAIIAESLFKSFFRGPEVKLYWQFTLFGCAAVYFPVYPVNLIVYAALLLLMAYWLNGHRRAFLARDLMTILPLTEDTEYRSAAPAMRLLLYPGVIALTVAFGASVHPSWWGILAAVPAGFLIARAAGSMWQLFLGGALRRRRGI
ncbi:ABC transporter permease [Paenibacillus sp. M1]|uniref:ABC transporter permease n=1 Tax=Paenibacillus haidiansis TaxID=1574488 RepID=A0ABU7VSA0_9BACL